METIIASIVTGVIALVGVIITNTTAMNKIQFNLDKAQAVTETKLDMLTQEVHKHNNFASRMPVVEEKLDNLEKRVDRLEEDK